MAVEFMMNIYGLTPMGKRIKIGHAKETVESCHLVGGKIFYIDPSADGAYRFYDRYGEPIENVSVGDTPYAYEVLREGTRDKYYVYHDEMYTSKRWTHYRDGEYVYEAIGGLEQGIGYGKSNTNIMMTRDNGAYVTPNSNGIPTIWYQLQQTRLAKAGGCEDWFIPSRYEIEELRKAIGFQVVTTNDSPAILPAGTVTGGVIAGTADGQAHYRDYSGNNTRTCYPSATKFLDNYIWSSSESSAQNAWIWGNSSQDWGYYGKSNSVSVFFARAF